MTFEGKKILVAGGTSGVGLAAAKLFADGKGLVTVTGRSEGKLKAAETLSLRAEMVDSTDRTSVELFFKKHGKFDHLVIAVSGCKGIGNFSELSLQTLREGFDQKFWAQLETMQAALPYVNKGGSMTLVTAISASAKMPGSAGLAAINGALEIMVPILAKELSPVRINAVSPGVVDTPWWDFLSPEAKQETFAQYAGQIPVGRVAQPEDIADTIVFLAGNDYMTGKVIGCDGGIS